MKPNGQEPDDVNPIADQNTERLLAGAYRPEAPDPEFLARVTAAMHAAAAGPAKPELVAHGSRSRSAVKRWIGWVAAAGLLLALGVAAGTMLRARPGDQRQDGTVRIDGKANVEADAAAKDKTVPPARHLPNVVVSGSHIEESATGTVALQQAAGTAAPQAAEVLQVGQSAETLGDQRRRLALADGSILYLNRDTAITLMAAREVTLRRGEIYVEVAQDPAAARFVVRTPRRQMVALGTKFNVRVAPQGTELRVTQGRVQVSDLQLPVLAGQQLMLDGDAAGPPDLSAAPARRIRSSGPAI